MTSKILENQVALVTAGGSGIGRAIADNLLAKGAEVHICDIDQKLVNEINQDGNTPRLTASLCDVSQPEAVAELFALPQFNSCLDILVNNAGIAGPTGPIEEMDIDAWKATFDVNIHAGFYCLRHAVPMMKSRKSGSIIHLSSSAGLFGYPLRGPYAAAKWGIIGLVKTLAMELGSWNIRVNAIAPGSVNGDRMDRVIATEAKSRGLTFDSVRKAYTDQVSLKLFVEAEDIANMAGFLCSHEGRRISGQVLSVDGHTESLSSPFTDD